MKRKIGFIVALVAVGTGLVAPTVEAGRTVPAAQCSWERLAPLYITVRGSFTGIRYTGIDQVASSPVVSFSSSGPYQLPLGSGNGRFNRINRTEGDYYYSNSVLGAGEITSIVWTIVSNTGKLISSVTCPQAT